MSKAAFMGRNGTIHTMPKNGLLNIADCRTLEGSIRALNVLGQNKFILSVVTNEKGPQPGGVDYLNIVGRVENWIRDQIYSPIYFQYCHHHHAKKCACRLPKIGLIKVFKAEHKIDMGQSIMFASCKNEVLAAESAKIGTILRLNTGKGDWTKEMNDYPIFDDLYQATTEVIESCLLPA